MRWSAGIKGKAIGWMLAAAILAAAAQISAAAMYSFTDITHNSDTDAVIGQTQFFLEVSPGTIPTKVRFEFTNTGPAASSICDVYFDDGSLLGLAEIINSTGVSFGAPAAPANLPGGASIFPPFVTTAGFSADSNPPVEHNGVNPGETLSILFDLQAGRTYADVLSELALGDLRVGLHAQGFAGGGSESFINDPDPISAPVPGSFLLCSLGIAVAGLVHRQRLNQAS